MLQTPSPLEIGARVHGCGQCRSGATPLPESGVPIHAHLRIGACPDPAALVGSQVRDEWKPEHRQTQNTVHVQAADALAMPTTKAFDPMPNEATGSRGG